MCLLFDYVPSRLIDTRSAVLTLLLTCSWSIAADEGERLAGLPEPRIYLVKTRVMGTYELKGKMVALHSVEHVYGGNELKVGAEFEYKHVAERKVVTGRQAFLPSLPQQGEKAIWVVKCNEAGKATPVFGSKWGIWFPSREGVDKQYADVERLAAVHEELQSVPAKNRLEFLAGKASSDSPLIGHWAIATIAFERPELYWRALDQLINRKDLAVGAQVALDEALLAVQGDWWQQSDTRFTMAESWMAAKLTPYERSLTIQHLSRVVNTPDKLGFSDQRQEKMKEALRGLSNRPAD